MASSDALIVGEDWISEHYFTTDAKSESFQAKVAERRKAWDEDAKNGAATVRSRFVSVRLRLGASIADLLAGQPGTGDDSLPELYAELRQVLGYESGEYVLKRTGPVLGVVTPEISEGAPLVIVEARAVETIEDLIAKDGGTLLTPYEVDEKTTFTSAARLLSALFVADDGPEFALVLAGRWLLVAERARWAEGRYLAVDLQLVCERNDAKSGGEIDRALTCVSAESLAPDAEGGIWWRGVLEDSIKHTVGVSKDLREGVRLSIEIIANEVVRRRQAQGLDPLPQAQAQPLARQALRYLYRILFLLYAEASPELEVLPVGAEEYDQGYGLDRLRDLTLVELASPRAMEGTHLYDSLARLFVLVDQGHEPPAAQDGEQDGLVFHSLRADLFLPAATALIDETGLGNAALQRVLRHLLLSKEARGKDRGFISYAELGINQLGAVYEGLMSYTGFFAETDLYEVAKDGDASKGSWVVPVERADGIAESDFVRVEDEVTGERKAVLHQRGTFVYRLAGRERQQSASYYTPEVLTRFTVSQALEELLDQDGHTTTAEEILGLTVCEPALGSGAFAIEAVRQLAEQYLRRRQAELGERIDPDKYPTELQRVKASIALHQVYGVDLNATAVELAEISLWLDTMVSGLAGAMVRPAAAARQLADRRAAGGVHACPGERQVVAEGDADRRAADRHGRGYGRRRDRPADRRPHPPLPAPRERLGLGGRGQGGRRSRARGSGRAEGVAQVDRRQAEPQAGRRAGRAGPPGRVAVAADAAPAADRRGRRPGGTFRCGAGSEPEHTQAVTREQIEATLNDPNGAYQRLRRVMDAWAALWFWPLTDTDGVDPAHPRPVDRGVPGAARPRARGAQEQPGHDATWRRQQLGRPERGRGTQPGLRRGRRCRAGSQEPPVARGLRERSPSSRGSSTGNSTSRRSSRAAASTCSSATRRGCDRGRTWTRCSPRATRGGSWPSNQARQPARPNERRRWHFRESAISSSSATTDVVVTAEYLGSAQAYPLLAGLQPDLYRCFMEQTWKHASRRRRRHSHPSRDTFHRREGRAASRAHISAATSTLAVHQ